MGMFQRASVLTVGILTRRSLDDPAQPFGRPTTFFAECCVEAARLGVQVVVFEADDLDPDRPQLRGSRFIDGSWTRPSAIRFPDVVYDRAPLFDPACATSANRARVRLIDAGVPFINPLRLLEVAADKLATYRLLAGHDITMPATARLDEERFDAYLDRFGHLFVKPVRGSNGTGVIEVKREHGLAVVRYGTERVEVKADGRLWGTITALMGNEGRPRNVSLIQQGISTARTGGQSFPRFDLRVMMQKDERKAWGMTGLVARVSQSDVPTTNLSTGARAEVAEHVLDDVYGPAMRRSIIASVTETGLGICQLLDRDICPCGELGIDIVTDAAGRPWVIEINAKPGRSVFKRIAQSAEVSEEDRQRFAHIRQRSVAMPFRYARTLV